MIAQGEVWWTDFGTPPGPEPRYLRPSVVVQADRFNDSGIGTIVCVPVSSNPRLTRSTFAAMIAAVRSGLDRESFANATQIIALDKSAFVEHIGRVSKTELAAIFKALDLVLGR